jgi:hypothetical protein
MAVPSGSRAQTTGMNESNEYTLCGTCGEEVSADDPDVVRAFVQVPVPAMGTGTQRADGLGVLFHRGCFPGGPSYRLDE